MIEVININRAIFHRVYGKKAKRKQNKNSIDGDAFVDYSDSLLSLERETKILLVERIDTAFRKGNKFFKLEFEVFDEYSYFDTVNDLAKSSDDGFIEKSQKMADILADSHHKATIPGGLLLILEAVTKDEATCIISIKAELQDAFTVSEEKELELIKDIFLSPAKDFYKMGLFLEESNRGKTPPNDKYSCYMYDDHFNLQKTDLTSYFYKNFLGCTTDKNDKLKSKNFYQNVKDFIEKKVSNIQDIKGLKKALKTLYREEASGIIHPKDFADKYLEGSYYEEFMKEIVSKYPESFTKDTKLLERTLSLNRISIPLSYKLKLEGSDEALDDVVLLRGDDTKKLSTYIDSGERPIEVVVVKLRKSSNKDSEIESDNDEGR